MTKSKEHVTIADKSYSDSLENWDLFDVYPPHIREESFI